MIPANKGLLMFAKMVDADKIVPPIKNIHKTHPTQQYNVLQNILGKYGFIFTGL